MHAWFAEDPTPQVLQTLRHETPYLFLGAAFATVGLIGASFLALARKRNSLVLWFSLFSLLYGLRLWIDLETIQLLLPAWPLLLTLRHSTGFLLPVPAIFYFEAAGFVSRKGRLVTFPSHPATASSSTPTAFWKQTTSTPATLPIHPRPSSAPPGSSGPSSTPAPLRPGGCRRHHRSRPALVEDPGRRPHGPRLRLRSPAEIRSCAEIRKRPVRAATPSWCVLSFARLSRWSAHSSVATNAKRITCPEGTAPRAAGPSGRTVLTGVPYPCRRPWVPDRAASSPW